MSLTFMVLALGIGLLLTTNHEQHALGERAAALCDLYLVGPFRFFRDVVGAFNLPALRSGIAVWFIPVCLGSIFLFLLVSANPLLEKWISMMKPDNATFYVSTARLLFWAMALSIVWPFIHVRWRGKQGRAASATEAIAPTQEPRPDRIDFFGVTTILRSLILFNLLFAVQTVLDVVYLWGNAKLPDDISYASYAHRGAYPLILTALLAAGFVLAAMRPGGPAEKSAVIRPLVYFWVAQNVLLVASSILRLDLYVQISPDVVARRGLYLDAARRIRVAAHRRPYCLESLERLVDQREPRHPDGYALCLLAGQFRCPDRGLQCQPQPRSFRQRRWNRHKLPASPWPAGLAGHRQGHRATWL